MPRSAWKGLFFDNFLVKHVASALARSATQVAPKPVKVFSRRSTVLPQMVGLRFEVHNGRTFRQMTVTDQMVGHKFGEFALTRRRPSHPDLRSKKAGPTKK